MYWKLVETLEFDYQEQAMSTEKVYGVVMAKDKTDAIRLFRLYKKHGIIVIPSGIDLQVAVEETDYDTYCKFMADV